MNVADLVAGYRAADLATLAQLYRDARAVADPAGPDVDELVYDSTQDAESAGYTMGLRDALDALGYPVDQLDQDDELPDREPFVDYAAEQAAAYLDEQGPDNAEWKAATLGELADVIARRAEDVRTGRVCDAAGNEPDGALWYCLDCREDFRAPDAAVAHCPRCGYQATADDQYLALDDES